MVDDGLLKPVVPLVVGSLLVVVVRLAPRRYPGCPCAVLETEGFRPVTRVLPLVDVPRVLRDVTAAASAFLRPSSAAFRAKASRRSSSRFSVSCLRRTSFSMSAMSWVAPCQEGFKISL